MSGRKKGREKCPAEHTDIQEVCGDELSFLRTGFGDSHGQGHGHYLLTKGAWVAPVCALPRPGMTTCRGCHVLVLHLG